MKSCVNRTGRESKISLIGFHRDFCRGEKQSFWVYYPEKVFLRDLMEFLPRHFRCPFPSCPEKPALFITRQARKPYFPNFLNVQGLRIECKIYRWIELTAFWELDMEASSSRPVRYFFIVEIALDFKFIENWNAILLKHNALTQAETVGIKFNFRGDKGLSTAAPQVNMLTRRGHGGGGLAYGP